MKMYGLNFFSLKSYVYHIKEMFLSQLPIRIYVIQFLMKKLNLGSFEQRLALDGLNYSPYAYGMYCAALQAKSLGLKKITAIEFGVGHGYGLMSMEKHAIEIKNSTGVEFEIFGFDTGIGLPKSSDYRD